MVSTIRLLGLVCREPRRLDDIGAESSAVLVVYAATVAMPAAAG